MGESVRYEPICLPSIPLISCIGRVLTRDAFARMASRAIFTLEVWNSACVLCGGTEPKGNQYYTDEKKYNTVL
jgi:hypothetical protein